MSNYKIARLKKDDCENLISFLNEVFTEENGREMHFENLYPRIFISDDNMMGCHLSAKEDGKIRGIVAAYPFNFHIGGDILVAAASGNVAVDSSCRGKGLMQLLMNQLNEENQANGIDFAYLHGDRWRYRHFGYERCGVELAIHVKSSMLRNLTEVKNLVLTEITEENKELTARLFEFYNSKQHTFEERKEESFYLAMTAKGHMTYAITENDNIIGYMTVSGEKNSVIEIFLEDASLIADVMKIHMLNNGLSIVYISVPAYHDAVPYIMEYADRYVVFQPGNFVIYNFKKVTEAFMREKASYDYLPDGKITVDSEIFGKWSIEKAGDSINVEPFDGEADFVLKGHSIYQFMFGTLPPSGKRNVGEKEALAKAWFPLPLYGPYLS